MKPISRKLLTVTAAASLVALTGCAQGVEDVPALSEIDDLMWETMAEEGSVTLSADLEMIMDGDEQTTQMFAEMFGDDASSLNIYGPLDGSSTAVSIGDSDFIRVFGEDEAFLSGDALVGIFASQTAGLDESQQEQMQTAGEELSGNWIDFSSELAGDSEEFNLGSLFSELQDDWDGGDDSSDTPIDKNEISDEGTHEVRDDIDVWVYPGEEEGQELVLIADHDAPKFYQLSDEGQTMKFTKWGETESPERPAEDQLLSQDEAQQLVMEAIMSSAMGQ